MITNFETNKVYLAKGMTFVDYVDATDHLLENLHNRSVAWNFLPQTASPYHIWARDYMPIQVNKNKFVRFRYIPDYLEDDPEYKPDISAILAGLGLQVIDSDIIIDGGNIISCGDKVIMTDKIFKENPNYSKVALIDKLTVLLEAEPILIPWDKHEEYGHADGMVRYMGNGCVLLNNYCDFDKTLRKKLLSALNPYFNITELHYSTYTKNGWDYWEYWAYLNFLHVGRHIFIPMLDNKPMLENEVGEEAFRQIAEAFPDCECHPIWGCGCIVREGGALNCSTWNILVDLPQKQKRI
ncbi:MAG: agmatine deiminase family protein [Bacteroidaceae bacterium]|nr:agmatine deiminase family protein [Bacteroidaceae bacterium]